MTKTKKEITEIIKFARKKNDEINKQHSFHCHFCLLVGLETIEGFILEINPYEFDLRSGKYHGMDLRDGIFKTGRYW